MKDCIVFWQRMLTPHMTELAQQVSRWGVEVHYVTEESLSEERLAMGWKAEDLAEVTVHFISLPEEARTLVNRFPSHAVHITQGVRSNNLVAHAQKQICAKRLRHYPIMEKVDLRGFGGWVKPFVYTQCFRSLAGKIEGIFAIGEGTPEWIAKRSARRVRPIPFAYFLKGRREAQLSREGNIFKFIFVGGLIERKRVDLLIKALSRLSDRAFIIEIVGDGPERSQLQRLAEVQLPGRVAFLGTVDMDVAIDRIATADCLVLPSDHDGWGAVVSEAQISGTPAVCSSECGAAGTVHASEFGSVFRSGDVESLRRCLAIMLDRGPVDSAARQKLATWARCLTAEAGARYLLDIVRRERDIAERIIPPWEDARL